ncbi:DUF4307 domain-containing protein [Corynebacterium pseudotuberculosis]|uniref:DUF4307 domain-containing protein n=1 Tax=Corynebacterium pseudotuberculosis 258 TaxID=1168865 RepID=A0AAU8Q5Z2_CORPS|nr:DUF4307 domain-containing protein [Corynebacterium pseudotuberculosis]AER68786.1 Hypothetical protein Cp106_0706 [Corynebacterium pseudotuberculosis 1/06-A]AEQ06280.1 DUF4307 domain-containing protein [Corynebacterium pseudotuberculosis CIP 52.97]AFB72060.1 DUF4307 domain-containing protein [Corynebacterium pseudotuberculosis 316]AFH90549.1 DUF4307 domain-containing protein [Corynebacterium pseudotuberculosis 31]AFK16364.1 DUF4307 domain-containing protein [Corynebacterium pseudotuberculosi
MKPHEWASSSSSNISRTRYSAPQKTSNLSGKLLAVLILVIVAAIAVALIKFVQKDRQTKISGQIANVMQVDDNNFKLTVDVTRDNTSVDHYCIVTALDYEMAEVGRREFFLPSGGDKTQRIEVPIKTSKGAVSGNLYGCSDSIPFYLHRS